MRVYYYLQQPGERRQWRLERQRLRRAKDERGREDIQTKGFSALRRCSSELEYTALLKKDKSKAKIFLPGKDQTRNLDLLVWKIVYLCIGQDWAKIRLGFPKMGREKAVHHLSFLPCSGVRGQKQSKTNFLPPLKYASVDVNSQRILKYL